MWSKGDYAFIVCFNFCFLYQITVQISLVNYQLFVRWDTTTSIWCQKTSLITVTSVNCLVIQLWGGMHMVQKPSAHFNLGRRKMPLLENTYHFILVDGSKPGSSKSLKERSLGRLWQFPIAQTRHLTDQRTVEQLIERRMYATHRLISTKTVSMLLFLLQCAKTGNLFGSTEPSVEFTKGRLTRERKLTVGGASGYCIPHTIFRL